MWNATTGKQLASFYGHYEEVTDSQFTVDSRLFFISQTSGVDIDGLVFESVVA